ncbi:MAG: NADH:ubiquinone reductase (Na(+)-transporting) subunit B [Planctomycetota bacterium]
MLRKLLDAIEPTFGPNGKLNKLYPLYEAADTFLYTPGDVTKGPTHVRDGIDLKRMMSLVVVALGPCFFMAMWNTGYQANLAIDEGTGTAVEGWRAATMEQMGLGHDPDNLIDCLVYGALFFLPIYATTIVVGGLIEVVFATVRGHEVNEGFLVTSALFPLTLPPNIPLWQVATGIAFGVLVGKEIFGGTGRNFLNPALTARAYLYFAHSPEMVGSNIWTAVDGFSSATPLGAMADAGVGQQVPGLTGYEWTDCFIGWTQGSMGETSTLACLLGAGVLIAAGVGSWRIMASTILGAIGMASVFYFYTLLGGASDNPLMYLPPWWHLVIGSLAFGAVFMATDPVSAATTQAAQWWYGALIGVLTILIRVINPAYPEGIMLAILFGNVMAPVLDYFVVQANIKRRAARYAT